MEENNFEGILLNMVLDEIDDLIIIHDSEYTIVWMNRAALQAFGKTSEEVLGIKCYRLFGRTSCCGDCKVIKMHGGPTNSNKVRRIPGTDKCYSCSSVPYRKDGKVKLVVQHLMPLENP